MFISTAWRVGLQDSSHFCTDPVYNIYVPIPSLSLRRSPDSLGASELPILVLKVLDMDFGLAAFSRFGSM